MSDLDPIKRRWWREPLLWFFVIGVAIFWLDANFNATASDNTIEISTAVSQRIQTQWETQMGRPPSADELQGLLDQWLREEVYYREARNLGLDANDTIVRRRLVQKLTFLTEDIATAAAPEEKLLEDYFANNAQRYKLPPRFGFRHRYFSVDRREDAQADAKSALLSVRAGLSASEFGDPFMLQFAYAERTERQIADLFGRDFAAGAIVLPKDKWAGPVRSAYGWHLVHVTSKLPAEEQTLSSVRDRVIADYTLAQRERANAKLYESLREKYTVVDTTAKAPVTAEPSL